MNPPAPQTIHDMYYDVILRIDELKDNVADVKMVADGALSNAHAAKNIADRIERTIGGDDGQKGIIGRISSLEHDKTARDIYNKLAILAAGLVGSSMTYVTSNWQSIKAWWHA